MLSREGLALPRSEPAQVFPYYRSPQPIRNEVFSRRLSGPDPDTVDEYLNLPADLAKTTEPQRTHVRSELEHLQADAVRSGGGAVEI